jgi:2-succinyl-5-enolpyruvyl-6-hydroxy-3-cyclohexene-1-carboxylate synthase
VSTAALNAAAARALVGALVDGGLRHAVISPGSRSTPLVLALDEEARQGRLALRVVLDERSAAFFALGLARSTGRAPLLLSTSGSAGAHWYPAAVEASEAELPLLLVTADRPPELSGCGAPQAVDQARFFGAFARASLELGAPAADGSLRALATAAARALALAQGARPGPVHLNAPFREPLWASGAEATFEPRSGLELLQGTLRLADADLDRLARQLFGARGLIVAGPNARPRPVPEIALLGARLGWPVLADPASGLRYGDFDRSAVILRYDAFLRSAALRGRLAPERVLRFGSTPCSKVLSSWLGELGRGGTATTLVAPSAQIRDPEHAATSLAIADPAALCQALLARDALAPDSSPRTGGPLEERPSADQFGSSPRTRGPLAERPSADRFGSSPRTRGPLEERPSADRFGSSWLSAWTKADAAAEAALQPCLRPPLWEGSLARAVVEALPDGALLHVGNGMPVRDLDGFGPRSERRIHVVAQRGASGIDGHLSAVAGESCGWREGPVVAVVGDLAFLHDIGGLRLVADAPGPLAIVVVDNGGGGIFEFLDIAAHERAFEPYFLTPQRADLEGLARGFGVSYRRAEDAPALGEALRAALAAGARPVVIHAPVDRRLNVERHREAWEAASRAASGASPGN